MNASALHDFDFLPGRWKIHHRRLKERLKGCTEWETFEGTSTAWALMDGRGNVDDNVVELPSGPYRAVSVRAFDPEANLWSIWWIDGRYGRPPLDPPVRGRFENGVGTFMAEEMFEGRPIRVRFLWSDITPSAARWQQAFSEDGGKSWETNWVMELERA